MDQTHSISTHFKPLWFIASGSIGFILAVVYALRYKFPDLHKRLTALEKAGEKSLVNGDLESAIDSFHTVCRFNQVSCQKENEQHMVKLMQDLDKKLETLYEKLNNIALCNAKLTAKVELLVERENGNGNSNH